MKSKRKLKIFSIIALVLVVLVLAAIKVGQIGSMIKAGKAFVPPPESVTSAKVEAAQWQPTRAAIGTLVAVHGVTLGAELTGAVREIAFDSGQSVKEGDVLVRLDTSLEKAQLKSAIADAELAKLNLDRAIMLRKGGSNSQADLDAAQTRATQTEATVSGLRATIAKKTIRATFNGRIGMKQVELGQVVSPGTPIASLQSVDPIYAEFSLPQQALAEMKIGQQVRLHTDIFPKDKWEGTLSQINSEVDVGTRNVRVRAIFANADGRLRPGMFANVNVLAKEKEPVIFIPATAVIYAPYGDSVYILEEKKDDKTGHAATVAHQTFIRLGERRGDLVAVQSGLKAGETVVSSGVFKLRNGMQVVVKNDLAPNSEMAPTPTDN